MDISDEALASGNLSDETLRKIASDPRVFSELAIRKMKLEEEVFYEESVKRTNRAFKTVCWFGLCQLSLWVFWGITDWSLLKVSIPIFAIILGIFWFIRRMYRIRLTEIKAELVLGA